MRNKRKGIMMAAAILGSAAIISTGFAAWVITTEGTETAGGNVEVDTVQDRTHNITVTNKEDMTVAYGFKKPATTTYSWLSVENGIAEDFEVKFEFEVTNPETCDFNDVTVVIEDTTDEAFKNALDKGYVAKPKVEIVKSADFTSSGKASLSFTFGWGEYFDKDGQADDNVADNLNPYEFFNNKKYSDEAPSGEIWAKEALNVLQAIEAFESETKGSVKFSVVIKTKTVTAPNQD